MHGTPNWPRRMWIVRHGQSTANVAREDAESQGLPTIGLTTRDADAPLTDFGREQARQVGRWFLNMPEESPPRCVLTSPFKRARETAGQIVQAMGQDLPIATDERLREKDFGILDGLTAAGIEQQYPREAARRKELGSFLYRPPGGESWCDVVLRLRSLIDDTLTRKYERARVLIVCHGVVIQCLRYLLEEMTEQQVLEADRTNDVANCSITSYGFDADAGINARLILEQSYFRVQRDCIAEAKAC